MRIADIFRRSTPPAPEPQPEPQPEPEVVETKTVVSDDTIQRSIAAAIGGHTMGDWMTSNRTADRELTYTLDVLRARSRDFAFNNGYFMKFLRLLETNVVGDAGITLQMRVQDDNGTQDSYANKTIEAAWYSWAKYGQCTTDKQYGLPDLLGMLIKAVARDGEIFVRIRKGYKNRHRFALQIMEADYCPTNYNDERNGNKIRNGIEYDADGAVVAYYLYKDHPGDNAFGSVYSSGDLARIPADQIVHLFIKERPSQGRGIPWIIGATVELRHLSKYVEAEVVAARAGAAQAGWIKTPTGTEFRGDTKSDGYASIEVEPGVYKQLPTGWDVVEHSPSHPNTAMSDFLKGILRYVAATLGASYNAISGDLESVNYSSLRQGAIEERDAWKLLQRWLIDVLMTRIFEPFLETQLLAGIVPLPLAKFDKFCQPWFFGRRYQWVDPVKDVTAATMEIDKGLKSRTMVLAEQGLNFEDVVQDFANEEKILAKYGVTLSINAPKGKNDNLQS